MHRTRTFLIGSLTFFCCNLAAVTFVNNDGSVVSDICIAAAKSDQALSHQLQKMRFTKRDLRTFTCNGLTLREFIRHYRDTQQEGLVNVYAFEVKEDNRESKLCVAAATSNQEYHRAKKTLFADKSVSNIVCNGLPLVKFARRFGNRTFTP